MIDEPLYLKSNRPEIWFYEQEPLGQDPDEIVVATLTKLSDDTYRWDFPEPSRRYRYMRIATTPVDEGDQR
jgi:hypothetical protein